MLTIKKLKDLEPQTIFGCGDTLITHPWFNDARILYNEFGASYKGEHANGLAASLGYRYVKVNWVAVRGHIHDWAIYHSLNANLEYADYLDGESHLLANNELIAKHGAKMRKEEEIKKVIPCTDEAFKMYRH